VSLSSWFCCGFIMGRPGEGFLACWGSVWPGEGLSLKYRLYAPWSILARSAGLFWLPSSWALVKTALTMLSSLMPWIPTGWVRLSPQLLGLFVVLSIAALLACCCVWRKLGDLSFSRSLLSGECKMETVLVSIQFLLWCRPGLLEMMCR